MAIKISETVERWCCNGSKDLKEYRGKQARKEDEYRFCIHCGQIFVWSRRMDPAGSMEDFLKEVVQGDRDDV